MLSQTRSENTLESDLAALINLAGKLRMLSHQVVMSALLRSQDQSFGPLLTKALQEFEAISQKIDGADERADLAPATIALLRQSPVVTPEQRAHIATFLRLARDLSHGASSDLAELGRIVSGPLLAALNGIGENIRAALDKCILDNAKAQEPLLRATLSSLDGISRVAKALQIVAMNASLEAQRAGEHGAAFGEIAKEMRGLSIKTLREAGQLSEDVSQFSILRTTASGRPV